MSSYADSESAQIAITTVHSVLAIVNLTGNTLVCAVIVKNPDMRKSINYLLANLAIADMTLAVFFAPRYIFMSTFTHPDGVTGTILCELITGGNLAWVGSGASVFTLVSIAIERYYAVIIPFGNKYKLTKRKLKVLIPCSWIFGMVMMTPEFLVKRFNKEKHWCTAAWPEQWMPKAYSITWFLFMALFPVVIMATLYSRVVFVLWCKRQKSDTVNYQQQGVMKVRKRVTLMAVTVSAIFAVCWLTDSISYILSIYTSAHSFSDVTYMATSIMIMFNAAINPIVYALVNKRFREKIKGMMCCDDSTTTNMIHPDGENSGSEGGSRFLQRTQTTTVL